MKWRETVYPWICRSASQLLKQFESPQLKIPLMGSTVWTHLLKENWENAWTLQNSSSTRIFLTYSIWWTRCPMGFFPPLQEEDISHSTGLPSRYLRTIFRGHIDPSVNWAEKVLLGSDEKTFGFVWFCFKNFGQELKKMKKQCLFVGMIWSYFSKIWC